MNQAGQLHTPLVVVLNDNQMSIKPNVGAFQLYLNRFRLDPGLTRLREDMERTIARIPAIGARAYSLGKDVKESMKAFLGPGLIFEELGFAYIGVVNGHESAPCAKPCGRPWTRGVPSSSTSARSRARVRTRRGATGRIPRDRAVRAQQRRTQAASSRHDLHRGLRPDLVREARRDPGSWRSPPP